MGSEGNVHAGEATVHWRRAGQGPALVLLHGFPLSGRTWDGVVARLRDRYTCIAPDLIGLGQSSSTTVADYSSQGQARALRGALESLGVRRFALVGNDTGGWVARELALIDPGRVSQLVLTNTEIPGHRPPWVPTYQVLARSPAFGPVLRMLLKVPGFLASPLAFGGCFHDRRLIEGEFRGRYVEPLVTPGPAMDGVRRFLRCMKFDRLDEFRLLHADLAMPTHFIWGADDPTFPEALARDMATQFPRVTGFDSLPAAKLFLQEERPEELARLIAGALSGHRH